MADGEGDVPQGRPFRPLFVNENLGGHRALHRYMAGALAEVDGVAAEVVDVPAASGVRRLLSASVPGLDRLDVDLQPLRAQLAASVVAGRLVASPMAAADAVHVYSQNAALTWSGRLRRVPAVVATDGTGEQNGYTLPYRHPTRFTRHTVALTRRFEERVYAAATVIVAQSDWARRSLVGEYGIDPDRIRVIRYGIPLPAAPERVATDLPEITFVGTTLERKGGHRLLASYRRVLAGRAVLNLVTPEPVSAPAGVRVHADVQPGDGKLAAILSRTAALAFPSTIDKSSFAVMEAMGAAVAPVVFDAGGVGELVEDGVSGWVVPDDDAALDAALVRVVEQPDRARQMGEAARRRAATHFDVRVTTGQVLDALSDAASIHRDRA